MNKEILRLAIPNIITNITVPLLGMVDLAIVGHIGNETYIGAIALGTAIFNLIYWNFGFLRMGTSGLAAQAYGAGDKNEAMRILVRGLVIALCTAVILVVLQYPIAKLSGLILNCSDETLSLTLSYFYVRIWAAPATLGLYSIKGWFIGMQNSKSPMAVAIALNIVNIVTSLVFVLWLKMGIVGVALGTVLAQYSGLALAVILWFVHYGNMRHLIDIRGSLRLDDMKKFFKLNSDIFLRTLCLCAVFTFIPAISASMGDSILAANTLIMQLFTLFSYILDGFAYAGESLVGKYIGAKKSNFLKKAIRYLIYWGLIFTALFTIMYFFWSEGIYGIITSQKAVISAAMEFNQWTLLIPICGFAAFLFDGIYIGATAARSMRNIMFVATAVFFVCYFILQPILGNDGLWIAFLLFLVFRGGLMWIFYKKIIVIPIQKQEEWIHEE